MKVKPTERKAFLYGIATLHLKLVHMHLLSSDKTENRQ